MKKARIVSFVVIPLLSFLSGARVYAQSADERVASLLNEQNYFALAELYPRIAGDVQMPLLRHLSEFTIGSSFNRPAEAISAAAVLLEHHQHELGFDGTINILIGMAMNMFQSGIYGEAADMMDGVISEAGEYIPADNLYSMNFFSRIGRALGYDRKPSLSRPDHDVRVPLRAESVSDGYHMMVPVSLNGGEYEFIFDTGAAYFNFVSENFAEKAGIRVIADSIPITGVGRGTVKLGIADSLAVGEMIYYNPVFMIASADQLPDSLYTIDAVLGNDFMRAAGELRIDNRTAELVFPVARTSTPAQGRNMMMSGTQPYLRIGYGELLLMFHFDTGNNHTYLHDTFYKTYEAWVRERGTKRQGGWGGFGGVTVMENYRLPSITFLLGGIPFTLSDVDVATGRSGEFQSSEYGSLGVDFVMAFDELIVNYDDCFVTGIKDGL